MAAAAAVRLGGHPRGGAVRFETSLSRILFFVYTGLDFYVVGHFFGRAALGLYKAAADLALDPARIISTVVVSVAFPAFSRARERPRCWRSNSEVVAAQLHRRRRVPGDRGAGGA
ncbi:oligosaccharide flippase family protein [Nannocystis pusilla]|uniref:oligosaccharide flippase family protein n=1 Tax=Nannocystis pusilla TaxID=889268 RepID=UPI003B7EE5B5